MNGIKVHSILNVNESTEKLRFTAMASVITKGFGIILSGRFSILNIGFSIRSKEYSITLNEIGTSFTVVNFTLKESPGETKYLTSAVFLVPRYNCSVSPTFAFFPLKLREFKEAYASL